MNRWIEPAANWLLAPVGVVLIGYTAAHAGTIWQPVILVAVVAATLAFVEPRRWLVWGVLAALAVPTGHASAAVAGIASDVAGVASTLSSVSALLPGLVGAVGGRWIRDRWSGDAA